MARSSVSLAKRHEPQHDHRGARELILVAAPELAIGLEHVQVRI